MKKYVERMMRNFDKIFRKKNKFGLEFIDEKNEPYVFNIGRAVEVVAGGPSFMGIYRGLRRDGEEFVLFPFAMPQTLPESIITSNEHGRVARIYQWSDRPALIIRERVCMLPVDEEYLFMRVEQARELNPRIILPDEVSAQDWRDIKSTMSFRALDASKSFRFAAQRIAISSNSLVLKELDVP